jgi:3'-5' exoribonuclease
MNPRGTGGSGERDSRTFCGAAFPWPLIGELVDGDDVAALYLVLESRRSETRANKPYLKLVLGDSSGSIDAMVWDDADLWEPACAVEAVVGVRGKVGSFQDRLQLRVQSVERIRASPEDMARLLPASRRPREEMERELTELIGSVEERPLRSLLERCLGDESDTGERFLSHPAAKRNHHAYLSGLLEHSLSVAGACDRLAAHYRGIGVELDRDLLIAGALLHDIGKLRELKGFPGVVYTTEGQLLGHIVIGIQMVSQAAESVPDLSEERLLLLLHLIASHQGRPEWDSPKVPQMLEALVLHYADDLDAKLNQAGALLDGVAPGEWSAYDRSFARSFMRPATPDALPAQRALQALRSSPDAAESEAAESDAAESGNEPVPQPGAAEEKREPVPPSAAEPAAGGALHQDHPESDHANRADTEDDGSVMDLFR